MKLLLFDQNLSPRLVERLADIYPGSVHVSTIGMSTAFDIAIWEYARQHDYIIVTKDVDFSELGLLQGVSGQLAVNPQTHRLYGHTGSVLFQAFDEAYGRLVSRVFLDGGMRDYAVYPALSRLYVTHASSPADWGRKVSVIQDTTWIPKWVFLPLTIKNK